MKQIKISVLEFEYHSEVLRDFCRLTENSDFLVSIFTTEAIWDQVDIYGDEVPGNIQIFLKAKNISFPTFISKSFEKLNNSDVILFNTVASNFKYLSTLKFDATVIVRIHNSNAYFNKSRKAYTPRLTPFFLWKDFSHFLRKTIGEQEARFRKKFLRKVDFFVFPSKFILQYAIDNYHLPIAKAIVLPMSFASDKKTASDNQGNSPVTITVTGRIDQRIRDYELLYKAMKRVLTQVSKEIQLILLGSANSVYGRKIVNKFKALESEKFSLLSFNSFIEQDLFSKYIDQTDFFILPIKINTRYAIYDEKYGYTKISGSINDILKYRKPGLIISEYPLEADLKIITESFKDEDELAEKVLEWSDQKKYKLMDVDDTLKYYELNNLRRQFNRTIAGIIE